MAHSSLAQVACRTLFAYVLLLSPFAANAALVGYSINFTQTMSPHGDRGLHGEFFIESVLLSPSPTGRTLEFYPGYSNQVSGLGGGAVLYEGANLLVGLKVASVGADYEFLDPGQPNYPLFPVRIDFAPDGSVIGLRTNLYKLGCVPSPTCHAIPATLSLGTAVIPGVLAPSGSIGFSEDFPVGPGSAVSFAAGYYSVAPLTAIPIKNGGCLFAAGVVSICGMRRRRHLNESQ